MLDGAHRKAEALAAKAGLALRAGERAKAFKLYQQAATQEEEALGITSQQATNTRAALAVSVASLWYKARRWQEAENSIYRFLTISDFNESTRRTLKELLEAVLDEQALEKESNAAYASEGIELRLRGGKIGFGTAPLDPLLHVYDGLRSLCYRMAEYVKQLPFRTKGLPLPAVREVMQARTTQPLPGSYRLLIRFVQPAQLEMFEHGPFIQPSEVSQTLFDFIEHVAMADETAMKETVPDDQYRKALLKLLRNITPDGKQMTEVEFVGLGSLDRSRIQFTSDTRLGIRQSLGERTSSAPGSKTIVGVLRGLDLDRRFIDLTINDEKKRLYANDLLLDDVIGPMVNQRVNVIGVEQRRKRQVFSDIEIAVDQDGT